jgi:hypothetical protein
MARQSAQRQEVALDLGGEEVREASMRLPERQREALTLRGAEQRSYEEIAAIMETSRDSVPQLISRARINLYDELRGTVLASVAPPSPDCERALPLIAARDDEQLETSSPEVAWLDAHLTGCDRCRLGEEQMREADASYRSLAPIAAASAKAPPGAAPAPMQSPPGGPPAPMPAPSRIRLPRGRAALAGAVAALLLLGVLAAALVRDDGGSAPVAPAADAASGRGNGKSEAGAKPAKGDGKKGGAARAKAQTAAARTDRSGAAAADSAPTPLTAPAQTTSGGGAPTESPSGSTHPSGKTGVEPTKQTSASKPAPAPTATPTSQPSSGSAPATTEAPTSTEEPSDAPGRSGEAPGKPSSHPSH